MSVPASLMMNQFQGMSPTGGMMGTAIPYSGAPNQIQPAIAPMYQGSLMGQMGPWSQLAYQMAGSPRQGPYPSVATPPLAAGSSAASTAGGIGGLMSSITNNPSLAKNLGKYINGLMNPSLGDAYSNQLDTQTGQAVNQMVGSPASVTPPVTTPDQPLYSGASNSNADVAANEADQYAAGGGLLGAPAAAAATAPTATVTVAPLADAAADVAAPAAADAAATDAAATAAAPAATDAAGGAAAGIGGSTIAAGAGAAAIAALPILAEFGLLGGGQPSGLSFVQSLNSQSGRNYFNPTQIQQIQSQYGKLGEAGFWQWFQSQYPGFGQNRPNRSGAYQPS